MLLYLRWIKGLNSPKGIINFSLKQYRNRTFLIQPDKNITLTFADFKNKLEETILYFRKMGLNKGDVLAYASVNSVEYFKIRAACHILGVVFFGMPASLSDEDLDYFVKKTNPKALFKEKENRDVSIFSQKSPKGEKIETSLFSLNLSSGTTQKTPKIVRLTSKNWIESLYNYVRNSEEIGNKQNVFLCALPLATAGSTTFLPSMLAGVTQVVTKENPSCEVLADYIKTYKVNILYITPSRLLEFIEWCKQNKEQPESLKKIITGTERFPAQKLKDAIGFFGPIIYVGYGMVEALPPISMLTPGDYHKLDSVGRVARGVKVKILDDGRIAIKSKTVAEGYLDNPDESAYCFKDGWFYTSDYGCLDKDGFLYIFGRKEEILAEKPRRIFASEVEDKLYALPFVKRCAVIKKGAQVGIFASLKQDADKEEAKNRIIRLVEDSSLDSETLVVIKEDLPVNALGKLNRRALSEEIG